MLGSKTETDAGEPDGSDERQRGSGWHGEHGNCKGARAQARDPPWRPGIRNGDGDGGEGEAAQDEADRHGARNRDRRVDSALVAGDVELPGSALAEREVASAQAGDERGDSDRRQRLGATADVPLDRLNGKRHQRDQPEWGEQRACQEREACTRVPHERRSQPKAIAP